ncbi:glutathione transferase GstA [uncultured Thiothrix sp.]|uniref:glutathione transferase GstA n=1 Tax=uncultured Thiothrix sp. TaxID=223185 RepID=UPI0026311C7A|nr:glutathione transferase GstA [uncultured Thiothrix sp.]HMT92710.1 glutathione transferase GstA [Thiolinea sp.]
MKLFISPGACSLSPHIALQESGLAFEVEKVNLKTKLTESGVSFPEINPKGYVPALLLDSGELLTEGPAIVQYIADQVPEKNLVPAHGTMARYELQAWLTYIGTELHKSFVPFFHHGSADWQAVAKANLEARYAYVNQHLADKNYLLGEDFSVADGYLFTVTRWLRVSKLDLAAWPHLTAFQKRMAERPGVHAALKAEGLAS